MRFRLPLPLAGPLTFLSSLLLLSSPQVASAASDYNTSACNNSPHLCNRSYGSITHLGTHNSPFLRDSSTDFSMSGNQYFNVTVQLDAGVRLLQGQVHKDDNGGEPRMCHSSCLLLDAGTLGKWLGEIGTWMGTHTNEVVTLLIVNDDNISADKLLPSFTSANLVDLAYVPPTGVKIRKFPTLKTLISKNKRLVVFITSGGGTATAPFLLPEFNYIWETKWENTDETNWTCGADRPTGFQVPGGIQAAEKDGFVPLLNFFLYEKSQSLGFISPYESKAPFTNGPDLEAGLANCSKSSEWSSLPPPRVPIFVLVDFFNAGPAIDNIDKLNNVTDPVNRVAPPTTGRQNDQAATDQKPHYGGSAKLDELLREIDEEGKVPTWGDWIIASGDWGDGINLH